MPITAVALHSFCIVVSYLGGIKPWPHPWKPLAEIRDKFKEKFILGQKIEKTGTDFSIFCPKINFSLNLSLFRDYYVLGQKIEKTGTDSKGRSF